jgi:hypothetical protein
MTTLGVAPGSFWDFDKLLAFEVGTGTRPDIAYTSFDDVAVDWSGVRAKPFVEHGTQPMLTWGPVQATLADLAAGKWDAQINRTARWSNGTGVQVRFAAEMNLPTSPYHVDPALYVAAWKRARKVWRDAGNAAPWWWAANVTGGLPESDFRPYYPGDDQCEFVGLDGYSYPKVGNPSFAQVFDADLTTLAALSTRPLAIVEVGVDRAVPNRAAWIRAMWEYVLAHPRIEHLTCWNRDAYRIDDDPAAALAFHLGAVAFTR